MDDHYKAQVESISDALQELMHEGPVKARDGLLEAIEGWYDYHQNEALNSLNSDDKSQAFRQIIKLMYKAEVLDRGSYRYAMYDIFELDYGDGLAHYMQLHNLIHQGLEAEQKPCKKDGIDERNDDTCDLP